MHDAVFAALIYALPVSFLALYANRRCILTATSAPRGPWQGARLVGQRGETQPHSRLPML